MLQQCCLLCSLKGGKWLKSSNSCSLWLEVCWAQLWRLVSGSAIGTMRVNYQVSAWVVMTSGLRSLLSRLCFLNIPVRWNMAMSQYLQCQSRIYKWVISSELAILKAGGRKKKKQATHVSPLTEIMYRSSQELKIKQRRLRKKSSFAIGRK